MSSITLSKKDFERFWSKVNVRKTNDCWEWNNTLDEKGYGHFQMTLPNPLGRENPRSHRVSWVIKNGPIPKGMCVLHKCDNPPCVNPDHLFLGDYNDNNQDRVAKGRSSKGEKHPKAKLKRSDIPKIKKMIEQGLSQRQIAAKFGVSHLAIGNINRGTTWKHLQEQSIQEVHNE